MTSDTSICKTCNIIVIFLVSLQHDYHVDWLENQTKIKFFFKKNTHLQVQKKKINQNISSPQHETHQQHFFEVSSKKLQETLHNSSNMYPTMLTGIGHSQVWEHQFHFNANIII